ncbi:hypothetical protein F5B21DRAFT_110791 [Xylaria acuta]|nr:hypothetical protein F5B21DRAFT_110791 [Xylaria acuta]
MPPSEVELHAALSFSPQASINQPAQGPPNPRPLDVSQQHLSLALATHPSVLLTHSWSSLTSNLPTYITRTNSTLHITSHHIASHRISLWSLCRRLAFLPTCSPRMSARTSSSSARSCNSAASLLCSRPTETHLNAGNGAQIIGRVNPDLSVKVYNALDLGNDVDFQAAQSVVEITHQYKELFVYDNAGGMN